MVVIFRYGFNLMVMGCCKAAAVAYPISLVERKCRFTSFDSYLMVGTLI